MIPVVDPEPRDAWNTLRPGTAVTVVKLAPEGEEVTRYPGAIVATNVASWAIVRAIWTHRLVELDGLQFHPGDQLLEWFSPQFPFNAFAVHAPDGALRGWYANVAYPARLDPRTDPPLLLWHDLYVDLVGLPDGSVTIRDDDELEESGLLTRNPALHAEILAARAELLRRFTGGLAPFLAASSADAGGAA